jgi:hypothetical protein
MTTAPQGREPGAGTTGRDTAQDPGHDRTAQNPGHDQVVAPTPSRAADPEPLQPGATEDDVVRRHIGGSAGSAGTGGEDRTGTPGNGSHSSSTDHGTHSSTGHGSGSGAAAGLLPHDECDKLELRLRNAVSGFVDRPKEAVEEADQVVEEIAGRFTEALTRRRRTLRMSWQGGEDKTTGHDTEQLRLALRDYRELAERLLH